MRLNDLDKTSIKYYLSEDLKKDSSLNEHWDRIDNEFFKPWQKYLNEATLTPDQINQMFAAAEKAAIDSANPNDSTLPKSPYVGVQFAAIPEFQAIGIAVGQQMSAALAGKTSVDKALKASQVAADREMKKGGYYK